jgi:hypothetical protein
VAPETLILTDQGQLPIHSLHGKHVNVWNGKQYSNVEIVQTGESQPLIEVHTNENILQCTLYHKFYIQNEDDEVVRVVEAQQLQDGDRIARCEFPTNTVEGGFLTSDQTRPATMSPTELVVKEAFSPPCQTSSVPNSSGLCSNKATFRVSSEEATRNVSPLPNSDTDINITDLETEEQYSDFTYLNHTKLAPFLERYFYPSNEIESIIDSIEYKYNIQYENTCVLFFRGNLS